MEARVEQFLRRIYADLTIDHTESQQLNKFFIDLNPHPGQTLWCRATAFRIGTELLCDDHSKNTALLMCINSVVNAIETTCMIPKPFQSKVEVLPSESIQCIGVDQSIERAVQHLWDLDDNRLTPDKDYFLNLQKGKKVYDTNVNAREHLFEKIEMTAQNKPTFRTFIELLDNYVPHTGVAEEDFTECEKMEIVDFLRAIGNTACMKYCHKYCVANNPQVPSNEKDFARLLYKIWFDFYRRGGVKDSSGFEHVFVGELKNGEVTGFHNWVQFYLEEKRGLVNYKGYIHPKSRNSAQTDSNDQVLTIQFDWHGVQKNVGTSFVGTSPEFEFAVYTLCFLCGKESNIVELNTGTDIFGLDIKCYKMATNKIGTCYPVALEHYEAGA
eukprot:GHVN01064673.1.p1 GENE.GHVN01064673.1~~GHVN01064673.1.p1  ORF type:complete len:384 (-),score=60.31 GHVN01064673.1:334-1485(-)